MATHTEMHNFLCSGSLLLGSQTERAKLTRIGNPHALILQTDRSESKQD